MNYQTPKPDYLEPYAHLIKELHSNNDMVFNRTGIEFNNGYKLSIVQQTNHQSFENYIVAAYDKNGLKTMSLLKVEHRGTMQFHRDTVEYYINYVGSLK